MEPQEGDAAGCLEEAWPSPPAVNGFLGEAAEGESAAAGRLVSEDGEKPDLVTLLRYFNLYHSCVVGEESIPDPDEKIIESSIEDLEREMEEVKVSYENKTLALRRIQVADALRTKLKNNDHDSKFIYDKITHILMLNTAILASQQQSRELEEKLNEVKQSRLALKRAGECKLAQIHDMKKKQKEDLENMEVGDMLKRIRTNLQQEVQMTTLIQNIFQNLVTGSGVNWAKDPALKAVVLQLAKNVMEF
ncbi:hypothetical protein lerEdw1_000405 [Lerista edwardsae]|nr:hypothetical protein lerEdw1_000405 [Lerista edwardsae]